MNPPLRSLVLRHDVAGLEVGVRSNTEAPLTSARRTKQAWRDNFSFSPGREAALPQRHRL